MGGLRHFALRFGRHTVGSSSHQDGLLVNNAGPSPFQWRVQSDERHRWQLHLLNEQIPRQRWWALLIWIAVFVSEIIVRIGSALVTQTSQHVTLVAYSIPPIPFRLLFGGNESEVYQWVEEAWPRTLEQRWPTQDETWLVATVAGSRVVGSHVPNAMDRVYWMPLIVVCMCLVLSLLPLQALARVPPLLRAANVSCPSVLRHGRRPCLGRETRTALLLAARCARRARSGLLATWPPAHQARRRRLRGVPHRDGQRRRGDQPCDGVSDDPDRRLRALHHRRHPLPPLATHALVRGHRLRVDGLLDSTQAVYTGGVFVPTSSTPTGPEHWRWGNASQGLVRRAYWQLHRLVIHRAPRRLPPRMAFLAPAVEGDDKLHDTNEQLRRKEVKLQYEHHSVTSEHALLRRDNDQMQRRLSSADEISSASDTLPGYESFAPQPAEATAAERGWVKAEFDGVASYSPRGASIRNICAFTAWSRAQWSMRGFHGTLDNTEVAIKRLVPVGLTRRARRPLPA